MINKLSVKIAKRLLSNGIITNDEYELYIYGLFMLISHIVYLVLICAFGVAFKCFIESVIFYFAFQFIRRYAGGYHASTETRCEIMSTLSILGCIGIIKMSEIYDIKIPIIILALVSVICIFILCPLDTPEKPLSKKEYGYFRKISLIVLGAICLLAVVSFCFEFDFAFSPLCMSLMLENILLVSGKIKSVTLKKGNAETVE